LVEKVTAKKMDFILINLYFRLGQGASV